MNISGEKLIDALKKAKKNTLEKYNEMLQCEGLKPDELEQKMNDAKMILNMQYLENNSEILKLLKEV